MDSQLSRIEQEYCTMRLYVFQCQLCKFYKMNNYSRIKVSFTQYFREFIARDIKLDNIHFE